MVKQGRGKRLKGKKEGGAMAGKGTGRERPDREGTGSERPDREGSRE